MSELLPQKGRAMMTEQAGNTNQPGGQAGSLPAGLYRHKENGNEAILYVDPLLGDGQARAFVRAGFEFVREALPGEIVHTVANHTAEPVAGSGGGVSQADLKGVQARQDALEADNARLREQLDAKPQPAEPAEPAVEQTEEQESLPEGDPLGDAPAAPQKAFNALNKDELLELGKSKGLDLDPALSNAKLREAILAAE